MYDRKVVGLRIRKFRKQLRISQERLGDFAGVSGNYIGNVERGEKSVTIDVLASIATALNTTLAELTSYSELLAKNENPEILIDIVGKLAERPMEVQQDLLNMIEIYLNGIDRNK